MFAELKRIYNLPLISTEESNMTEYNANKGRRRGPRQLVDGTDFESSDYSPHVPFISNITQSDLTGVSEDGVKDNQGLRGDYSSIALLMFLYILQGIPLGLAGSIPMLLSSRHVSYKDQALFSFVYWPFSVKLLWAPLVDSIYIPWFGRRKTWLVPTQYMIGAFMLILSYHVKDVMGDGESGGDINILLLTVIFFMLNSLAATQDIAVDGWALTMLSRRNVGWASTCNTVGQTAGYFLGNVLFLGLESADFCNNYLRSVPQKEGFVTLAGFLYFWGIVFFITTTLVMVIKRERADPDVDPEMGIMETYRILYNVIKLPAVISYCIILLTAKVAFAATDSLTSLKLIESGMPKERLALFAIPMIPVQIILPIIISKFTAGPRPMSVFLKAIPFRIIIGLLYAGLVHLSYMVQSKPGEFPAYFYIVVLVCYALHQVFVYSMFVSQMAFHAKVSDPTIGGSYMTLLNTVSNLGGNWPSTLMLWIVDWITWKSCEGGSGNCYSKEETAACKENGGACSTSIDGYYLETAFCVVIGFFWLRSRSRRVQELDAMEMKHWQYREISSK